MYLLLGEAAVLGTEFDATADADNVQLDADNVQLEADNVQLDAVRAMASGYAALASDAAAEDAHDRLAVLLSSDPGSSVYARLGFLTLHRDTLWIGTR